MCPPTNRRLLRVGVVMLLAATATSCASSSSSSAEPTQSTSASEVPQGMCPEEKVVDAVLTCTRLFADAPMLRLPATTATVGFGAVARRGRAFVTVDGDYELDQALMQQAGADTSYATGVYAAVLRDGKVVSLKAVARIDEDALLTSMFGSATFEGAISAASGPSSYSHPPTLPVRVEMAGSASGGQLAGKIVNAAGAVKAADGTCLAGLPTDSSAPLVGPYSADIVFRRVPSMHGPFDDELTILWTGGPSNMSDAWYPSVAALLGRDPLDDQLVAYLHGNPLSGPGFELRRVRGGGGAC